MKAMTSTKTVFTEPYLVKKVETTTNNGFATIAQKGALTKLKLICPSDSLKGAMYVYVRADGFNQPWAREVISLDGTLFIMVPLDAVLAYE